jgi:PhoPQ-activated pathogenicity-related protein
MEWMDTPQFAALMKIEEPFEYRDRYTMPKLLINSAGDQFFIPDSSQFYWKDLPGQKYLRYVPNSDHSLKNTDAHNSLAAFHDAIIHKKALPEYEWELPNAGVIRINSKTKPSKVKLWTATNPNARDFRLESLGPVYVEKEIPIAADGKYEVKLDKPEKGWTAGFVELTFANDPVPHKFTSGVTVIPDTLPHKGEFKPKRPSLN